MQKKSASRGTETAGLCKARNKRENNSLIFPQFPEKNNILGVWAPSAGVGSHLEDFDKSLTTLRMRDIEFLNPHLYARMACAVSN